MIKKDETYSYKGWLNSDFFIKRVFGVIGYALIGQIFIMVIVLVLTVIFGVIKGIFGY